MSMEVHASGHDVPRLRRLAMVVICLVLGSMVILIGVATLAGVSEELRGPGDPLRDPYALSDGDRIGLATMGIALLVFLAGVGVYGVWIFKMWKTVQDEEPLLTPVAAVLFSFVPVVNLVGLFFAFHGLAKELNRVQKKLGTGGRSVSAMLALSACVCYVPAVLLGWIPLLGCVIWPIGFIGMAMWMVSMVQMADSGERICRAGGPMAVPHAGGMPGGAMGGAARAFGEGANPFEPPDHEGKAAVG